MKQRLIEMFLDWFNNFLTRERFAEHYGISVEKARRVIHLGRVLHEKKVAQLKQRENYA